MTGFELTVLVLCLVALPFIVWLRWVAESTAREQSAIRKASRLHAYAKNDLMVVDQVWRVSFERHMLVKGMLRNTDRLYHVESVAARDNPGPLIDEWVARHGRAIQG